MTEREMELLTEILVSRVNDANHVFLSKIGQSLKNIGSLSPTEAHKLIQILKYGGKYEEIINEIQRITKMNIKDIEDIFEAYSKKDQRFAKQFYNYRNKPFIEYDKNLALKRQTISLAKMTQKEMYNYSKTNALGYSIKDAKGNIVTTGLRETYDKVLDEAVLNVGQGKQSFDEAMKTTLNQLGTSGLKTLDYEGRSVRLDSAVKMHLNTSLRTLHNENQELFGKEFGADGVEISAHSNPAPDHAGVQGRQFSTKKEKGQKMSEWEKLQNEGYATDYTGKLIDIRSVSKKGRVSHRPISTMNCYHTVKSVVLGVNKPIYSEEQLQEIIEENNKGFELDGQHYTNYQGTQMQRTLERRIREQKDIQILAKASDNQELIAKSQQKISQLTSKYKELSSVSGLPTEMERMRVPGYRRVAVK